MPDRVSVPHRLRPRVVAHLATLFFPGSARAAACIAYNYTLPVPSRTSPLRACSVAPPLVCPFASGPGRSHALYCTVAGAAASPVLTRPDHGVLVRVLAYPACHQRVTAGDAFPPHAPPPARFTALPYACDRVVCPSCMRRLLPTLRPRRASPGAKMRQHLGLAWPQRKPTVGWTPHHRHDGRATPRAIPFPPKHTQLKDLFSPAFSGEGSPYLAACWAATTPW